MVIDDSTTEATTEEDDINPNCHLIDIGIQGEQDKIWVRAEYISSSGSLAAGAPNLLYGPGSDAFSITVTPTFQYNIYFARAEISYVSASSTTPGFALGPTFNNTEQTRVLFETGILF